MILPPQRRGDLSQTQWQKLKPLLPPQKPAVGRPSHNHRTIINGILWVLRTGVPWGDLPERYGTWETVSGRFYHWRRTGLWSQLLAQLQQQADADGNLNWDIHFVDGSVIRAHQHAGGAKRGNSTQRVGVMPLHKCKTERL